MLASRIRQRSYAKGPSAGLIFRKACPLLFFSVHELCIEECCEHEGGGEVIGSVDGTGDPSYNSLPLCRCAVSSVYVIGVLEEIKRLLFSVDGGIVIMSSGHDVEFTA